MSSIYTLKTTCRRIARQITCGLLCLCLIFGLSAFAADVEAEVSPLSGIKYSPWAEEALTEAFEDGFIPEDCDLGDDLTASITRSRFVRLVTELISKAKGSSISLLTEECGLNREECASPFSDTDEAHIVLAAAMGLTQGNDGLFKPDDSITRCEAATLIYRCMTYLGKGEANASPRAYSDNYDIPRWSVEAVKFCSGRVDTAGMPVMSGAAGLFSPMDTYTIEQAVATLVRCKDSLSSPAVHSGWKDAQGYDSVTLNLTFGGDCTFGRGIGFAYNGSFDEMFSKVEPSYFFSGIDEFFDDDITMVNFEGTLTDAKTPAVKTFCFKGAPEYAKALEAGSIDVVTVANNHSMDYLQKGFDDTLSNLSPYVAVSGYDMLPIIQVKGVRVGFASNISWVYNAAQRTFIESSIANLRQRGADIIVFNYHWGIERSYSSNATQQSLAHYCIDRGADLVIGHHPHVVQETETYKGKQIAYSLGNLVFGGNTNPNDKNCFIFRQSFSVNLDSREVSDAGFAALPYSVSSVSYRNDYHPTKQ